MSKKKGGGGGGDGEGKPPNAIFEALQANPFLNPYLRSCLDTYYGPGKTAVAIQKHLQHDFVDGGEVQQRNPRTLRLSLKADYQKPWETRAAGASGFSLSLFSNAAQHAWGNPKWFASANNPKQAAHQQALLDLVHVACLPGGFYVHVFLNEVNADLKPANPLETRSYTIVPSSLLSVFNIPAPGKKRIIWSKLGRNELETMGTTVSTASGEQFFYPYDIRYVMEQLFQETKKELEKRVVPVLPTLMESAAVATNAVPIEKPVPPTPPTTPKKQKKKKEGLPLALDWGDWIKIEDRDERLQQALATCQLINQSAIQEANQQFDQGLMRFVLRASPPQWVTTGPTPVLMQAAISRSVDEQDECAFIMRQLRTEDYDFKRTARAPRIPQRHEAKDLAKPLALLAHKAIELKHYSTQKIVRPLVLVHSPGLEAAVKVGLSLFQGEFMAFLAQHVSSLSTDVGNMDLYRRLQQLVLEPNERDRADPLLSISNQSLNELLPADEDRCTFVIAINFYKLFEYWIYKTKTADMLSSIPSHALIPTYGWEEEKVRRIALERLKKEDPTSYELYLSAPRVPSEEPVITRSFEDVPFGQVYRRLIASRTHLSMDIFKQFLAEHGRTLFSPFESPSPQQMGNIIRSFFHKMVEMLRTNAANAGTADLEANRYLMRLTDYHFFFMFAHVTAACFLAPNTVPPNEMPLSFAGLFPVAKKVATSFPHSF